MRIKAFIDSHLHALGIGYYQDIINLNSVKSIEEIVGLLDKSDKEIIVGRGFNQQNLLGRKIPEKADLSSFTKPVVLFRICGHLAVVNQAMLDYMNISVNSPQVSGGSFNYESGLFTEKALGLIYQALPKPSKNDLRTYLIKANNILKANGITKVASDDFSSFNVPYEDVIEVIKSVDEEGLLDIEITEQVNLPINELKDFIKKGYANKRFGNFKMGPLKILGDGSLGGRTAAMIEPYSDDQGNHGILTYTDEELRELIYLASANNMDTAIHAIGDRAVDQAIRIIKEAQDIYPRKNQSNAIIHAQITNKKQVDLMKEYGIGAIVQPIFINTDIRIVGERIGNRSNESYLFKTMYNSFNLGFSTDSPVEPLNPFYNLYCALTYKSVDYPDYECFNSLERFTIEEALIAYTINNYRYVYDEFHNDWIEIDTDIYNCKPEELLKIKVLKTYKNNKLIYERKNS